MAEVVAAGTLAVMVESVVTAWAVVVVCTVACGESGECEEHG